MLSEIQLQKLINRNFTYVTVSRDNSGIYLSKLTTEGWGTENYSSEEELRDGLNKYMYKPDVLVDAPDEV